MALQFDDWKTSELDIPLPSLPPLPEKSYEFQSCTLALQGQDGAYSVELVGPNGLRLEVPTKMPDASAGPDEFGETLFPIGIKRTFLNLRNKLKSEGKGLRIQLNFKDDTKTASLRPWEATRLDGAYLLEDPYISISRTVSSHNPVLPFEETPEPYRLLMVIAAPDKEVDERFKKDIESDQKEIQKALASYQDAGTIEIVALQGKEATLSNLEQKLQEQSFQALYLTGLGKFDNRLGNEKTTEKEDGVLLFDDGNGDAHNVFGAELGELLQHSSVRLVCIGADCSAYGSTPKGEGIAEMIAKAGIPAVVAFQQGVTTAISDFANAFFTSLTKFNSLELALLAGRKIYQDLGEGAKEWTYPTLFTRFLSGEKVFSGEIGNKISAFVNEKGEVEIVEQQHDETETDTLKRQLNSLAKLLKQIDDIEDSTRVQNELFKATQQMRGHQMEEATETISEAFVMAAATIKRQQALEEAEKEKEKMMKRKVTERVVVLLLAGLMIAIISSAAYGLGGFSGDTFIIKGLELPAPVVLWSFIGGVAATLYAFVGTQKYTQTEPLRLDWLIGRPIVGVIMGSVVYLAVLTSLEAVGSADTNPNSKLLWVMAFIGGFSDKFAILLFDNLVGKFTTSKAVTHDEAHQPPKQATSNGQDKRVDLLNKKSID